MYSSNNFDDDFVIQGFIRPLMFSYDFFFPNWERNLFSLSYYNHLFHTTHICQKKPLVYK